MIVGVFVVVGLCALVWLVFKFRDLPTAVTRMGSFEVYVQFPTAPGVQRDTPVRFCGYPVGSVTNIRPPKVMKDLNTGQFYHQTLVVLNIDKKYNDIPADVEAKLMARGLGSSSIELKLTHYDVNEPTGPFLIEENLLQGSTGITSEFFPEASQKKLEELVDGIIAFIANTNDIIGSPDNKENLQKILANLTEVSQEGTEMVQQAKQTIEEFRKFAIAGTTTFKNADAKVEEFVIAMVDTSEEISKASSQLRLILEKINTGQGSAAKLVNDGRFYENLLENTQQLEVFLESLTSLIDKIEEKGLRSIW